MILRYLIFFLICSQLCGKEKIKTYWEENGIIAVDLEDFEAKSPWKKETDLKGYTGDSYYTWRGPNNYRSAGGGTMEFKIIITKSGDYFLSIHNRHQHHDSTLENDCYTQMDDGRWVKTFSSKRDIWLWQSTHEWDHKTKIPAKYTLSAGIHTFRISGRSHGFSIDRFHLWHSDLNKKNTQSTDIRLSASNTPSTPDSLTDKRLISYWNSGKLGIVARECNNLLKKGANEEASKALQAIDAFAAKRKSQLNKLKEFAPSLAYQSLRELASTLRYTAHEKEIKAEVLKLSRDKTFLNNIQAEKIHLRAIETLEKAKNKYVRGKLQPISKRTLDAIIKAAKDIEKYSPNSTFYDDLAMRLEKLGVKMK